MQCIHKKPDGSQCRAYAIEKSPFCWFHDTNGEAARRNANSLGGKTHASGIYAPLPPIKLEDYHEISNFMLEILNRLRAGEINSHTAFAMAHIFKLLREWHHIDKDYMLRQENWRKRLVEIQSEEQVNTEEDRDEDQDEAEDEDQDEDQNEDDDQDEEKDEDEE